MTKRAATVLLVLCAAGAARAQECPTDVPDDPGQRRQLAKKWFTKGEAAAKAGDDLAALKSYQCSLDIVPHAFTAYNVGQLAEKIGDLDAAITSYDRYLTLAPDAPDAKEVSDRVAVLKDRLAKVKGGDHAGPPLDKLIEKTNEDSFLEPPPPGKPNLAEVPGSDLSGRRKAYRLAAWLTVGGGAVLVAGGVVSNVLARGQMDNCQKEYDQGHQSAAESACSNAKPLAYLSYGALGVGAAALVTGAVLMFWHPGESENVALNVLPEGGLTLAWSGRY
jgi:tetratricopeptide (TPR) repeat protein